MPAAGAAYAGDVFPIGDVGLPSPQRDAHWEFAQRAHHEIANQVKNALRIPADLFAAEARIVAALPALPEFHAFESIPRLFRDVVISEKLDGTNAQVAVLPDGRVLAGSRNRWLTVDKDNFGFAKWVADHEAELRDGLGEGTHYGEWWGPGIQRGYGVAEKRFSLFNVKRWGDHVGQTATPRPACCHVVPVIRTHTMDTDVVRTCLTMLRTTGSIASPGFMRPEGIVVFHTASRTLFKATLDNDDAHKGAQ